MYIYVHEKDKSSEIEQCHPSFDDRKLSNTDPQKRGTLHNSDKE